jgi:parvulin-like peptidyl-prolyl isomerase
MLTTLAATPQAGKKFDALAKQLSIDRSASVGGYLGALAISDLRAEFQTAVTRLSF